MAFELPAVPNLNVQIPAMPDPMQKYGQMLALKNMLGQQKLLPLQMQEEQQRVQQANISTEMQQTELDSQKAMMSAIAGGDLNKYVGVDTPDGTGFDAAGAYTHLVKSGALPTQARQYVSDFQTIAKNNSEIVKNRSQAGEAAMNLRSKGYGELADGLAPILDMKDPSKADEAFTNFKQELVKNPVPGVDRNDLALLYGADLAHLPAIAMQLKLDKQLADYHQKQAEATAAQEKLPGGAQENPEQKFLRLDAQRQQGQTLASADKAFLASYEKNKTLVPQFNIQMQGGAPGVPLTPAEQATVQAILEGRQPMLQGFVLKTPYGQKIQGAVNAADPHFTAQRYQLVNSYTTGKESTEINAVNTALGHIGMLGDAIDALNNGNIQALNKIANSYGVQTGATPTTTFKTIVNRVGPEIGRAYIGAGGGEKEREGIEADLSPKMSPEQLRANVGMTVKLLRSKIGSLENQWEQNKGPGMPSFEDRFIMPGAKTTLTKWSPENQETGGKGGTTGGAKVLSPAEWLAQQKKAGQ